MCCRAAASRDVQPWCTMQRVPRVNRTHAHAPLAAEVVLGTVRDVSMAIAWLKTTFLYVRIRKNPGRYGWARGMGAHFRGDGDKACGGAADVLKRKRDAVVENLNWRGQIIGTRRRQFPQRPTGCMTTTSRPLAGATPAALSPSLVLPPGTPQSEVDRLLRDRLVLENVSGTRHQGLQVLVQLRGPQCSVGAYFIRRDARLDISGPHSAPEQACITTSMSYFLTGPFVFCRWLTGQHPGEARTHDYR
jgi:hypothetical protein